MNTNKSIIKYNISNDALEREFKLNENNSQEFHNKSNSLLPLRPSRPQANCINRLQLSRNNKRNTTRINKRTKFGFYINGDNDSKSITKNIINELNYPEKTISSIDNSSFAKNLTSSSFRKNNIPFPRKHDKLREALLLKNNFNNFQTIETKHVNRSEYSFYKSGDKEKNDSLNFPIIMNNSNHKTDRSILFDSSKIKKKTSKKKIKIIKGNFKKTKEEQPKQISTIINQNIPLLTQSNEQKENITIQKCDNIVNNKLTKEQIIHKENNKNNSKNILKQEEKESQSNSSKSFSFSKKKEKDILKNDDNNNNNNNNFNHNSKQIDNNDKEEKQQLIELIKKIRKFSFKDQNPSLQTFHIDFDDFNKIPQVNNVNIPEYKRTTFKTKKKNTISYLVPFHKQFSLARNQKRTKSISKKQLDFYDPFYTDNDLSQRIYSSDISSDLKVDIVKENNQLKRKKIKKRKSKVNNIKKKYNKTLLDPRKYTQSYQELIIKEEKRIYNQIDKTKNICNEKKNLFLKQTKRYVEKLFLKTMFSQQQKKEYTSFLAEQKKLTQKEQKNIYLMKKHLFIKLNKNFKERNKAPLLLCIRYLLFETYYEISKEIQNHFLNSNEYQVHYKHQLSTTTRKKSSYKNNITKSKFSKTYITNPPSGKILSNHQINKQEKISTLVQKALTKGENNIFIQDFFSKEKSLMQQDDSKNIIEMFSFLSSFRSISKLSYFGSLGKFSTFHSNDSIKFIPQNKQNNSSLFKCNFNKIFNSKSNIEMFVFENKGSNVSRTAPIYNIKKKAYKTRKFSKIETIKERNEMQKEEDYKKKNRKDCSKCLKLKQAFVNIDDNEKNQSSYINVKSNDINKLIPASMYKYFSGKIKNPINQITLNCLKKLKNKIINKIYLYIENDKVISLENMISKNIYLINFNQQNIEGFTFLNYAAKYNAIKCSEYLLQLGCDANIANNNGNTPLHFALSNKNYELANLLLNAHIDETKKNSYGLTPWQCIGKILK